MAPNNRPAATPGEKSRAVRLRRKLERGERVSEVDQLWLADHEEKHPPRGSGRAPVIDVEPVPARGNTNGADHGRSRSGRKVKFEMEEAAEAEGTGAAAPTAASAAIGALTAREEGRRVDALTMNALSIMEAACSSWERMNGQLIQLLTTYQQHHLEDLAVSRDHFIARTEAEAAALEAQRAAEQAGDPAKELMMMALLKQLNVDLPEGADPKTIFAAAARQAGAAPPGKGKSGNTRR